MATDKSLRQHYAIQGGGPNYLGKQKMVTAPKKWLSSPDHEPAELAYITEKEKDILLDLNLYGSLKDGKPNRGPSGIMSLQGDMGGYGGTGGGGSSGGGGNGGGGGGDAREQYIAQQYTRPAPQPTFYKDPDPVTEVVPGDKTFEPVEKYIPNIGPSLHGDMKEPEETIQEMIARQQEEKYGPLADPTKMGETIDKRTQKEKDEDFERDQDWDLIKEMSDKGYSFEEIKKAVDKGLTQKAPTTDTRRQNLINTGLRSIQNIVPETGLEKSLLNRMKSFVPGAGTGIMSNYIGQGKMFDPKKMAMNFALSKMGLGFLNPILGIASLFGFKNPLANIGTKYAGVPRKKTDTPTGGDGGDQNIMQAQVPKDVISKGVEKFSPKQLDLLQQRYAELNKVIESGEHMGQKLNNNQLATLTQTSKQMKNFLVSEVGGMRLT